MSRTSRTLTNTDLAFLLCTLAAASQTPKTSLSFETDYGLVLSLEPDGSITIGHRKPPAPVPQKEYTSLDPFDSATPIKSQQRFAFPSSGPGPDFGHGSIDRVLSSPSPLNLGLGTGMGGASITPARNTPPSLIRTTSQTQTQNQQNTTTTTKANSNSSSPDMKIKYYIRPGLDANSSSHMYYTASPSPSPQPQHQPQPQSPSQPKTRLHHVKLSHLQSLYHPQFLPPSTSSKSSSNSWFDSYLDWIDRLEDALSHQASKQGKNGPQTPITALPILPTTITSRSQSQRDTGPFADSGERSLWLVEGMLLACWLSLQEGVERVEYLPLGAEPLGEEGVGVYRLERQEKENGDGNGVPVNNAGMMIGRLLEVIRAGE